MKLKLLGITLFFWCIDTFAQSGNVVSGVNGTGSGGTVSYNVVPIVYKKLTGEALTDGLQQPYEILTLNTDNVFGTSIELSFYPNPTDAVLHLLLTSKTNEEFEYQLAAIDGKLLSGPKKIISEDTILDLSSNPAGIYLVTVTSKNRIIKSFKIIKH
jgi:hypothetical protein